MAFPLNPNNGDKATVNGVTYTYSSSLTAWTVTADFLDSITANAFIGNTATIYGNAAVGNLLTDGYYYANGEPFSSSSVDLSAVAQDIVPNADDTYDIGNVSNRWQDIYSMTVTATGNVSGGNVTTSGLISATGNVSGGNVTTAGLISATGNVTGGNVTTGGVVSATGNVSGGNVTTGGLISATGNVTGGNLVTAGTVSSATLSVTGTATLVGSTSAIGVLLSGARERVNVTGTGASGTLGVNVSTAPIWFYNGTAGGNFTVNLNAGAGNQLNSLLGTGEACTFAVLVNNGGTAYYATTIQVDGTTSGVTTEWQGGSAPTSGNASSIDVYTFTVIKTASATYTVLASQTRFA